MVAVEGIALQFEGAPEQQRFEILSELGRGGMGVVYRARDRESGREVALKVVGFALDPQRAERFRREGEISARFAHPGIVGVHSCGMLGSRPYLAYELVQGRELGDVLPEVELERRVEMIRDAARALGYAHAKGVIHRDVKPENILVDVNGRVRVTDFGLATAQDLERMTLSGAVLGTPTHMSPEQIGAGSKDLGPPTDVWALGVILFQALTGTSPFEGVETLVELAGRIIAGDLVRPRSLNPDVPRALEAICLKALERLPSERYADANAMAQELSAYLAGKRSGLGQAARPSRALGLALALGLSAAALALLGAGVYAVVPSEPAPRPAASKPGKREALSPAKALEARQALANLLLLSARPRHARLEAWLEANPSHPDVSKAREALRLARLEFPVRVFDHEAATGERQTGSVWACFAGQGRVVTRGDAALLVWDREDPTAPPASIPMPGGGSGMAATPKGDQVVLVRGLRPVVVDLATHEVEPLATFPRRAVACAVAFSADGRTLAVGSVRLGIHLFSWPAREELRVIPCKFVRVLAFAQGSSLIAGGGGPGMNPNLRRVAATSDWLGVWETGSGRRVLQRTRFAPPSALACSPDGSRLVAGDTLGRLYTLELTQREPRLEDFVPAASTESTSGVGQFGVRTAHIGRINGVAFTADGAKVISVCQPRLDSAGGDELKVWDVASRREARRTALDRRTTTLQSSPDGAQFLLGSAGGRVELWLAEFDSTRGPTRPRRLSSPPSYRPAAAPTH